MRQNLSFSIVFICIFISPSLFAQNKVPAYLFDIIQKSSNKVALLKVLDHYNRPEDSLKWESACFLISNMDIHKSHSYFWSDSTDSKVEFDELVYPDFDASINAFNALKSKHGNMHPIASIYHDLDSIKSDYLISSIDEAFLHWDKDTYDYNIFREYILPYRIGVEPLHNWKKIYYNRFSKIIDTKSGMKLSEKIKFITDNINLWFTCTYKTEKRNEPLPLLGSLQLLHRKKGTCEDAASVSVFALRSMGIPATVDIVPFWATSTGGHVLNCTFDKNKPYHFDILSMSDSLHEFIREPAKVFRTTFSKQKNTLAAQIEKDQIPDFGLLRSSNYLDVTEEYWPTRDVSCFVYLKKREPQVVYACVFNGGGWRPVWWGQTLEDSVTFTDMCKGAVILPKYYENGKLHNAGYPVASGYDGVTVLTPDILDTHTIRLSELPGYLKFRAGKKYRLAYYDTSGWSTLEVKEADANTKEMIFENVPKNALLILMPNYGEKKERPFTITEDGQRLWW